MSKHPTPSSVEPLEARIAPATLTFTDVDNDLVTITTSKGSLTDLTGAVTLVGGATKVLQKLDLASNPIFRGTDLTISIDGNPAATVDVGFIDARGADLGRVFIAGDVGQIDAGDATTSSFAIRRLEVKSLGALGLATQGGTGELKSDILGGIAELEVNGDIAGSLSLLGGRNGIDGRITTLHIDGSLRGGDADFSGTILASGAIGTAVIEGDLLAAAGKTSGSLHALSINSIVVKGSVGAVGNLNPSDSDDAGQIKATTTIRTAIVEGMLVGGGGRNTGAIMSGVSLGTVEVKQGIQGGEGFESGAIGSAGKVTKVTITGDVAGGFGTKSGAILSSKNLVDVTINGSLKGGDGDNSGNVASAGVIGKVTITGDIEGSYGFQSGAVGSEKALGSVVVQGSVRGNGFFTEGPQGDYSGQIVSATSIGSVSIAGSLEGGVGFLSGAVGAPGKIGSISIGGSVIGGFGIQSGVITSQTGLPAVTIAGGLIGGEGFESGSVFTRPLFVEGGREGTGTTLGNPFPGIGTIRVGYILGGDNFRAGSIVSAGAIGSVTVGLGLSPAAGAVVIQEVDFTGSIYGGSGQFSGVISAAGNVGTIQIHGDIFGGSSRAGSDFSGGVFVGGSVKTFDVDGSVVGGDADESGKIHIEGNVTTLRLGALVGGVGSYGSNSEDLAPQFGQVRVEGEITKAEIDRSIEGGGGSHSGAIRAGSIKTITVGLGADSEFEEFGGIRGGSGFYSGAIVAEKTDLGRVVVTGDVVAGGGARAGTIAAQRNIGTVEVGALVGNPGDAATPPERVTISAGGKLLPGSNAQALAIKSVHALNGAFFADILAGYDVDRRPINGDAQIGTVEVGDVGSDQPGIWEEVNVVAGALSGSANGDDGFFGTADDAPITSSDNPRIFSKIAAVIVHGTLFASTKGDYGIVAQEVASVVINGSPEPLLTNGRLNDPVFVLTADSFASTRVNELVPPVPEVERSQPGVLLAG